MSVSRFGALITGIMALLFVSPTASAAAVTFTGNSNPVFAVAISPDGTKLFTGGQFAEAKLWNAATGAKITDIRNPMNGHVQDVGSVAFSPDGTNLLTGSSDQTAKLWDLSGTVQRTFSGHTGSVRAVAFSPDGTKVLTGSSDNTARLWNAATADLITTFTGHTNTVMSVAFSSDGTQVLTGSWDSTVKLWNVSTGAVTRTFTGFTGVVYSAALSPDGTKVLTADASRYPKLWNAATGEKIRDLTGHTATPNSVRFSPDGTRALTGGVDNTAKLWDVATGTMIHTFTGHTGYVNCVAYSADGTKVATASSDTTARLETIPFTGTIVINGNRSATNNAQATLALGWYGFPGMKVVRMRFSNDGATWSAWETLKSTPTYSLPAGDGHKTVRVQYLDINNNRSGVVSDYIRLDTVPPTGSIVINNGDKTTTNQVVWPTLAWDDGTGAGVSRMRFSNNGSTWTGWMPFMSTYPYALPSITPGYYTVRVQYLDGANNYSPIYNDYIKLVAK